MKIIKISILCALCETEAEINIFKKDGSYKTEEEVFEDLRDKGWYAGKNMVLCKECYEKSNNKIKWKN